MDSERLARYLAGEASQAERLEVEAWARADASHQAELTRLRAAWPGQPATQSWDVEGAWAKVRLKLAHPPTIVRPLPAERRLAFRWLAAAAVLAVAGGSLWLSTRSKTIIYHTAVGERRQIELPDGSRVMLAPASRLTVQPRYGEPERGLMLDGRAWFEVTHDAARPFRVRARAAMVEDLGTEFEIDATSSEVKVLVVSGSVSLTLGAAPAIALGPKDLGRVGPAGQAEVAHQVAVERWLSWRKGTLAFENRPMGQVLDELERWHDIAFDASPEVRARTFTGDLPTDRLEEALATISAAVGLSAHRTERVITLTAKAAP